MESREVRPFGSVSTNGADNSSQLGSQLTPVSGGITFFVERNNCEKFRVNLIGYNKAKYAFSEKISDPNNTIGVIVKKITIPHAEVMFCDTAGQERFRTLASEYLCSASVLFIFADTQEELEDNYRKVRDYVDPKVKIFLLTSAGNQLDCTDKNIDGHFELKPGNDSPESLAKFILDHHMQQVKSKKATIEKGSVEASNDNSNSGCCIM